MNCQDLQGGQTDVCLHISDGIQCWHNEDCAQDMECVDEWICAGDMNCLSEVEHCEIIPPTP